MDEVLTGAISSLHKKKLPCFSSVNNAKGGLLWGGSFEKEKKEKWLEKNINKLGCSLLNLTWHDISKLENNSEIQTHSVQERLLYGASKGTDQPGPDTSGAMETLPFPSKLYQGVLGCHSMGER